MKKRQRPLWGGGYRSQTGEALRKLSVSHPFDRRLAACDLAGSRAHARGLARAGLLSRSDLRRIEAGLDRIGREISNGRFRFSDADEDIHMNVERRLAVLAGPAGGRLHAGRSRNDQVAADLRLWTLLAIDRGSEKIRELAAALLRQAERFLEERVIVAGRTHLRTAQPVLLAHLFHAYVAMLLRDLGRFADARERTAVSPLGSGACAGTTLPLDRVFVARQLGLSGITSNSVDAVSDRDFAIEFAAATALTMTHLSRLAEDLILWTGEEFKILRLSERTTTGSSMMPQKKNPDALELVRGKTGRVTGDLAATLTVLKGLPLSYDRDLQETQEPLFDAADTLELCLDAMGEAVDGLTLRPAPERPSIAAASLATDVAEELVRRGVPFRQAHERVGGWARRAEIAARDLREVAAAQEPSLRSYLGRLTPETSVAARDLPGGTAPRRVRSALRRARQALAAAEKPGRGPAGRRRPS
jgi:argininosuccinate lyase